MFIFRSVFEIKSSYQIKHLILHPRVRIWPQDLRWVSSLHCRKHHNVNNIKLGCSTQCNFSSAAEFHWAGIWDERSGVRQAAGLREDSFEPHQPCCLLPTYCPAKDMSDLQMSSLVGLLRHPELLNPGHPGKDKSREDHGLNCSSEICQCGSLSEQEKVMSMPF